MTSHEDIAHTWVRCITKNFLIGIFLTLKCIKKKVKLLFNASIQNLGALKTQTTLPKNKRSPWIYQFDTKTFIYLFFPHFQTSNSKSKRHKSTPDDRQGQVSYQNIKYQT